MSNKVLFIFPNTANRHFISMSIPILAGIAKSKLWDIDYFDTGNYKKHSDSIQDKELNGCFKQRPNEYQLNAKSFEDISKDLQNKIDTFNPNIIAITAMTCDYEFLMQFWRNIDTKNAIRIIGGFHATVLPYDVLKTELFDVVCFGQGEQTFSEFLDNYNHLESIKGIYYRKDKEIIKTENRMLLDYDKLWEVNRYYSFFDSSYFTFPFEGNNIKMSHIEGGRGCPFGCSYCGNDVLKNSYRGLGKYLQTRPVEYLIDNARHLIDKHNVGLFNFTDECFSVKTKEWRKEFNKQWKTIKKPFLFQSRAEYITEEFIETILESEAPFIQIGMGVESGSQRILKDICDRKIDTEETIRAFDLINKYPEIRSNSYYMLGFPTETREEMFETIELCRRLKARVNSVAIYQPFPGQRMRDLCIAKGYIDGTEPMQTFTGGSILKQPHITQNQIYAIWKCFMLYAKLPLEMHGDIYKCEYDFENNQELYDSLVKKRWELCL
jgi:anaerobic magnesium-protoporphyrin IX monomethyl ester cyclase